MRIAKGDVIAGKYRVERVLGKGGMGLVLAATHLQLDELVAIKLMRAKAAANPNAAERFMREARAAARLKSPHVVKVYDVGQLEAGQPYMVMEHLDGLELRALLREHGPQTPQHAVDIAMQALEAVTEAHLAGVVHRDLKPANLFVVEGSDGAAMVKVLDFGISKVTTGEAGAGMDMTKTDTLMGSPFYMSPEQMRSTRDVDHRTDIWAVGTILYELLAGCLPFKEDTITAQCAAVLQDEPEPPSRRAAAPLPAGLDEIVMRCLEKEPAARHASAPALARALAPYGGSTAQRCLQGIERLLAGKKSDPARLFRQSGSFAGVRHPLNGEAPKGGRPAARSTGDTTVQEQADGETTLPRAGAPAASARQTARADAAPTLLMDGDAAAGAAAPADTAASWGRQVGAAGGSRGAGVALGLAAGAVVVLAMWLGMRLSQGTPGSTRAPDTAAAPTDLAPPDTAAAGAGDVARRGAAAPPSASANAPTAKPPDSATGRHAAAGSSASATSPPRVASRPSKHGRTAPTAHPRPQPRPAAPSATALPPAPQSSAVGAGDDPFGNSRF